MAYSGIRPVLPDVAILLKLVAECGLVGNAHPLAIVLVGARFFYGVARALICESFACFSACKSFHSVQSSRTAPTILLAVIYAIRLLVNIHAGLRDWRRAFRLFLKLDLGLARSRAVDFLCKVCASLRQKYFFAAKTNAPGFGSEGNIRWLACWVEKIISEIHTGVKFYTSSVLLTLVRFGTKVLLVSPTSTHSRVLR